ncbi:MAG: 30S ribosomal protein S15 [Nanoarchaeota archaeon]
MARMHSRKRGKSGSKFPVERKLQGWMRYTPKEAELLIIKLAREDHSLSGIGLILRDTYGIPNVKVLCGKTITQILAQRNLAPKIPEDLMMLIKRYIAITKHMEANKKDMTAKRGQKLTISLIGRLSKYYKREDRLPKSWKFDPVSAGMYLE